MRREHHHPFATAGCCSGLVLRRRYRRLLCRTRKKCRSENAGGRPCPCWAPPGCRCRWRTEQSAAIAGAAADISTGDTGASHEIILAEEEISDVSLATFYVFDKETAGTFRPGLRLAMGGNCGACGGCGGGCGCWTGTNYTTPVFGIGQVRAEEPLSRAINSSYRDHARLKVPSSSRQD